MPTQTVRVRAYEPRGNPTVTSTGAPCSFVEPYVQRPVSAVLADHAQLLECATLFDEADISADLALDLSVAQLQQLMPS